MSFHNDYARWQQKLTKENCPVCKQMPMPAGMVDIAELPCSWLDAEPDECMKWACHLTAKLHVIELFEFNDSELLGFMRDVQHCARALQTVTQAIKINYEIHGNSLPHLHVHLYPRTLEDPFPGQAINYHNKRADFYQPGEFKTFVEAMRRELQSIHDSSITPVGHPVCPICGADLGRS